MVIDAYYAAAFHKILKLNLNKYFVPFLDWFGSFEDAWKNKKYPEKTGMPLALWEQFLYEKKNIDPIELGEELERNGIRIIQRCTQGFSNLLLQINNIPCILYYCGDISLLNSITLAVVGSREATAYGMKQARQTSALLAKNRLTIVSGMARGIDTAAHEGALEAGGKTIAVLGSGLKAPYPKENLGLFDRIKEQGLVVSEFPPDSPPLRQNFPIRNRIISGLSLGVFVVEARARSGSLITCDFALEQGREVFALPGDVTNPNSIGTLRLIQNGAKLVIHPQDILEELRCFCHEDVNLINEEKELLDCINWEPLSGDKLFGSGSDSLQAEEILVKLEKMGLIKILPGKYYVRT